MIEQIPNLLLLFSRNAIRVTSDIMKTFVQISLTLNYRDFSCFIWKMVDGSEIIFRHKRVVFGVNVSPFLLGVIIEHHLRMCLRKSEEKNSSYSK